MEPEVDKYSMQPQASPQLFDRPPTVQHDADASGSLLDSRKPRRDRVTPLLFLTVTAAVVGSSTQFGYNTGVLNSPKQAIRDSFGHHGNSSGIGSATFSSLEMDFAVAIFAIGGMLGALPAGTLADLLGRKNTLLLNNVTAILGVLLESLAVHPAMFIAGRFVVGINSGVNTVLVPLYVSEISPVRLRGTFGVFHQIAITSTILLSEILGINAALGRRDEYFHAWRILFAVPLIFVVFQLATLPFCPKSPKYIYIKQKRDLAATKVLRELRGRYDVAAEVKEMEDELRKLQRPREKINLLQFVVRPSLRRALLVSIVLHLSQQLSGIVGVLYYSSDIFAAAGIEHGDIATIVVGVVLVVFTIITALLIDMVGRRSLMLYGLGGMAISFMLLTSMFCFQDGFYSDRSTTVTAPGVLLVVSALGVVAFFSLGPGAIAWLMVAELFLQEARPVAVTIATITNWLGNFAVGLTFPRILDDLKPYGTAIFIVTCLLFWLYLYAYLPESRGRSVEDITAEFRRKSGEQPNR